MKISVLVGRSVMALGIAASLATGLAMATGKVGPYTEVAAGVTLALASLVAGLILLATVVQDE